VTKRQIAGVFQEIWAHSTYKRRGGGLIEAFGTCLRRRGAESGVESFEESSCLVILLRKNDMNNDIDESECIVIQKGGGEVGKRGVGIDYDS
jgi:hypothetical protein